MGTIRPSVDVGEPKARTVVSGLVKHVPLEEMQVCYNVALRVRAMNGTLVQNRMVVLLCNLKPAK